MKSRGSGGSAQLRSILHGSRPDGLTVIGSVTLSRGTWRRDSSWYERRAVSFPTVTVATISSTRGTSPPVTRPFKKSCWQCSKRPARLRPPQFQLNQRLNAVSHNYFFLVMGLCHSASDGVHPAYLLKAHG